MTAALAAQNITAPDQDPALKERVTKFYTALKDQKYKQAFPLVADDAQDAFMGMAKFPIKTFTIDKIEPFDGAKDAVKVFTTVERDMNIMGRIVPARIKDDSYWRLENKEWMWFQPPVTVARSPIGATIQPGSNAAAPLSTEEIKRRAAEVPPLENFANTVDVKGPSKIDWSRTKPGEATFTVKNSSTGWAIVRVIFPNVPGLECVIPEAARRTEKNELGVGPSQTVAFQLKWTPGTLPKQEDTYGRLELLPLGRYYQFSFAWKD